MCPSQIIINKINKSKSKNHKKSSKAAPQVHTNKRKKGAQKKNSNPISAPIFKFGPQFSDSTSSYGGLSGYLKTRDNTKRGDETGYYWTGEDFMDNFIDGYYLP